MKGLCFVWQKDFLCEVIRFNMGCGEVQNCLFENIGSPNKLEALEKEGEGEI